MALSAITILSGRKKYARQLADLGYFGGWGFGRVKECVAVYVVYRNYCL